MNYLAAENDAFAVTHDHHTREETRHHAHEFRIDKRFSSRKRDTSLTTHSERRYRTNVTLGINSPALGINS